MMIFDKAPFPSCHASTLVETTPGRLLAAWFGGKGEGANDVQIWAADFDGTRWSEPRIVGTEPGQPCWNPVLFRSRRDELSLWYKYGNSPRTWTGAVRRSIDDGKTWGKVESLPAGLLGPVRAKPIRMDDGAILAGTSIESDKIWTPYVDRSEDNGLTWRRSNDFAVKGKAFGGQIQPTLFTTASGKVVALLRSRDPLKICRAESIDGGRTFSPAVPTELHNPSSGIDVVRSRSGPLYLIHNPNPIARVPITLSRSTDDGQTWKKLIDLETQFGEYSYPAMIETSDGQLSITYTWKRTHIKYVKLDPTKVG